MSQEKYILERDYNGFILCTDGKTFFTQSEDGQRLFESQKLEALKARCRKPKQLDIAAVILEDRYAWHDSENIEHPQEVHVYGVSPTGSFLYETSDGKKDKTTKHGNHLRRLRHADGREIDEFMRLSKAKVEALKAFNKFLDDWPLMKVSDFLGKEDK